jgi:hypothetical protein
MRTEDIDIELVHDWLNSALKHYWRARKDVAECNATGVKAWKAAAFRQLNHARKELKEATSFYNSIYY